MKTRLYKIPVFLICIFLFACQVTRKHEMITRSASLKLVQEQQLISKKSVRDDNLVNSTRSTVNTAVPDLARNSYVGKQPQSILNQQHKIPFPGKFKKHNDLKSTQILRSDPIQDKPQSDPINPFVPPILIYVGIAIFFFFALGAYSAQLGLGVFAGIFFLLFMIVALIVLLVWALSTTKEQFAKRKGTAYLLTWIMSLPLMIFPLVLSESLIIALMIPPALLIIMAVIYFILWFNQIPEKTTSIKKEKSDRGLQILFLIGWIGALVLVLVNLYNTPLVLTLCLVLLAGLFILWLWKLKPAVREIVYVICFALFLLLFLGELGGYGLSFIFFLAIALAFLFLFIRNLVLRKRVKR